MAWKEPRALAIDARSLDERAAALRQALGEREANALIGKRPDVLLASTSKLSDVAAATKTDIGTAANVQEPKGGGRRGAATAKQPAQRTLSSSAERAAAMAHALGGHVVPLGRLFRVQLGPFGDKASAQRARDGAARHGYGDAQILHTD